MKHIFILGATGMIGSALTKKLIIEGYSVTAACRNVKKAKEHLPQAIKCIPLDFTGAAWANELAQADAVINFSGAPVIGRLTPQHRREISESRVEITKKLVNSIEQHHPELPLLINASAIGIYGSHTLTDDTYTENTTPQPEDYLAQLSHDWEAAAHSSTIKRTVLVRTGVVFDSSNSGTLAKLTLPFKLFAGGTIGIAHSWRSWIHIDDEIGLILHALEHRAVSGPLNATAPHPVRASELAVAIGTSLNRPSWLQIPEWAVRIGLGEAAEIITRGKRIVPEKAIETGYIFMYPTISETLTVLLH